MRTITTGALIASLLLAAAFPAHAIFGDDEARKAILEMRAQDRATQARIEDIAKRLERIEAAQRSQLEFANTVDALRAEIAKLRGQVDVLTNEVTTLQKRNRDLYTDLDTRLKKLEPTAVSLDGKSVTVDRDEQAAYDAALVLFRSGDFRGAVGGLQQFLTRYPQSVYVPNAQYWLGNAHFALKDYRAAVAAQQVVIDRFSDSPRAPEALLNIAASQSELNDRTRARATLQKVIKEYPDTDAAKVARDRLATLR